MLCANSCAISQKFALNFSPLSAPTSDGRMLCYLDSASEEVDNNMIYKGVSSQSCIRGNIISENEIRPYVFTLLLVLEETQASGLDVCLSFVFGKMRISGESGICLLNTNLWHNHWLVDCIIETTTATMILMLSRANTCLTWELYGLSMN